jgi:hypothetical protein
MLSKINETLANVGLLDAFWIIVLIALLLVRSGNPYWQTLRTSACFALAASAFARHFEFADWDHALFVIAIFLGTSYALPQST